MRVRDLRIAHKARIDIDYQEPLFATEDNFEALYKEAKEFSYTFNQVQKERGKPHYLSGATLYASAIIHLFYQTVISFYLKKSNAHFFEDLTPQLTRESPFFEVLTYYSKEFPSPLLYAQRPNAPFLLEENARGYFVHQVLVDNKALTKAISPLIEPTKVHFPPLSKEFNTVLKKYAKSAVGIGENEEDLFTFLRAPALRYPNSLVAQISLMLESWKNYLPDSLKVLALRAIDFIQEEEKPHFDATSSPPMRVLSYDIGEHEGEAYSADSNWMGNVVMIAKSTLVWLDQLSKSYGYPITTLDQIPDYELDLLAKRGITALWLIGLWERSHASKRIKHLCGNPEAEASAYSLKSYDISSSIGGWEALEELKRKCQARGIRLASDMVPNHTGLDSDWVFNHPDLFISMDHPPFPSYTYSGENLSLNSRYEIRIEDHYYDRSDAAVTFQRIDKESNQTSYIFHGNDGTSMPWNDTAQLDFLNPNTREAVIQQILHVAKNFRIIRFDAAMTLAKKHIQRLWYPQPGSGGDIPGRSGFGLSEQEFSNAIGEEFWREVVDRVAIEVPDTLLLAEAFWMMEGYFVRTLGMHRVYNSAFMNMLKNQENKKYRDTIKNTISFDPEILKRFVNFMNNPDEETAIQQFGNGDKYFGVCTLLSTMPGLPMFGHGQIEGFHEKYGMEYNKAYWNEYPDEHLIEEHNRRIFPLLKIRYLFSGVDYFELFDVIDNSSVSESIFAYVNGTKERRSLVLYNNQYEVAQGRLFHSAPKSIKQEDGSRSNRTIMLAKSLNLTKDGRHFLLYENFADKLTYLLPSTTIFEEGLWVSLLGYETKVFLHMREVEDIDGSYETLYQHLGGRGTPSLEKELRLIRLQPLYRALENFSSSTMFEIVHAIVTAKRVSAKELRKFALLAGEAYARVETFYESLPASHLSLLPAIKYEVQPRHLLEKVETLIRCFEQEDHSLFKKAAFVMDELPLLILTALMMPMFIDPESDSFQTGEVVSSFMLDHFYRDYSRLLNIQEHQVATLLRRATFLITPSKEILDEINKERVDAKKTLSALLENREFSTSIGVNSYQGELWYNKEAFQESLVLITLGVAIEVQEKQKVVEKLLESWLEADLKSDYKVKQLISVVN